MDPKTCSALGQWFVPRTVERRKAELELAKALRTSGNETAEVLCFAGWEARPYLRELWNGHLRQRQSPSLVLCARRELKESGVFLQGAQF